MGRGQTSPTDSPCTSQAKKAEAGRAAGAGLVSNKTTTALRQSHAPLFFLMLDHPSRLRGTTPPRQPSLDAEDAFCGLIGVGSDGHDDPAPQPTWESPSRQTMGNGGMTDKRLEVRPCSVSSLESRVSDFINKTGEQGESKFALRCPRLPSKTVVRPQLQLFPNRHHSRESNVDGLKD